MICILIGPTVLVVWCCFDLEAEAESESAAKRGVLKMRGGDADPSSPESTTVDLDAVNPLDVLGSVRSVKTLIISSPGLSNYIGVRFSANLIKDKIR
jgi:hypothetical protein